MGSGPSPFFVSPRKHEGTQGPGHKGRCCAPENGEQRTERAGAKRQTFHGYGTPLRGDRRSRKQGCPPSGPNRPSSSIASCYGTSQTCLRVQGVFPPAGVWGGAPHLPIHQISFVPLAVEGLSLRACTVSVVIPKTNWQSFSVFLCFPLFPSVSTKLPRTLLRLRGGVIE